VEFCLQPENILCLTRTGNRVKIIDFGLARVHNPDVDTRVLFGTPEFMAPEVVHYEPIDFGTDMWSVGVISYVLCVHATSVHSQLLLFIEDATNAVYNNTKTHQSQH